VALAVPTVSASALKSGSCYSGPDLQFCNNIVANSLFYGTSEGPVTGTVTIDNGILTAVDLTLRHISFTNLAGSSFSFISPDQWTLDVLGFFDLIHIDEASGAVSDTFNDDNLSHPVWVYNNSPVITPIPPSSLLFATGLAGLGLLGWRRKKAAAG
jgi:hypothetical protein